MQSYPNAFTIYPSRFSSIPGNYIHNKWSFSLLRINSHHVSSSIECRGKAKQVVESSAEFARLLALGVKFEDMKIVGNVSYVPKSELRLHPVLQVLHERAKFNSKLGSRKDPYRVALVIEGGGMRGCVSAGMTAAIKELGMQDCFDAVYGKSSALFLDVCPACSR